MPEETVSMLALRCSRRRTRASPAAPGAGAHPSSLRRSKLQAPKSRGIRPNRPDQGESSVQNGVPGGEIQSGRRSNSALPAFARLWRGKPGWVRPSPTKSDQKNNRRREDHNRLWCWRARATRRFPWKYDPQRVAGKTEAENRFPVALPSARCGSQSRAPGPRARTIRPIWGHGRFRHHEIFCIGPLDLPGRLGKTACVV